MREPSVGRRALGRARPLAIRDEPLTASAISAGLVFPINHVTPSYCNFFTCNPNRATMISSLDWKALMNAPDGKRSHPLA
jgi:hypothetical protein